MQRVTPATFESGASTPVASARVGQTGGVVRVAGSGTRSDGVVIDIPGGALPGDTTVTVSVNGGRLRNVTGTASDIAVDFATESVKEFEQPVNITVPYPEAVAPVMVVGYAIDEKGRLHTIDVVSLDKAHHKVTFSTFQPILFTWVYLH